jgi:hypothetical protein
MHFHHHYTQLSSPTFFRFSFPHCATKLMYNVMKNAFDESMTKLDTMAPYGIIFLNAIVRQKQHFP